MKRPVEVLLVEDNPADARLTQDTLLQGPVPKRVAIVKDGADAINYVRRRGSFKNAPRPDIVLLDLNLPKRDGMQVLREMKSDPALTLITVIVLSTSDHFRDVNSAYDCSANCYIVKPRELEQFYAVMRGIEEFWMEVASLPTLDKDPWPSSQEDSEPPSGAPDSKAGSASARWSHRNSMRRASPIVRGTVLKRAQMAG
jgi:CheY-like chemotaxis protein